MLNQPREFSDLADCKKHFKPFDAKHLGDYRSDPSAAAGSTEQLGSNHGFRLQQSYRCRKHASPFDICYMPGTWGIGARTAPLPKEETTPMPESTHCPGDRSDCVDDKYLLCNFNEQLFAQKPYFCSLQLECKGVKDRILFWRLRVDASSFVLDTIVKGLRHFLY